ncbi:hypothetical protein [Sphingosinicella sp.]|uniref:hypothetical protein n=1 Tax=Sphingosinicella sp. TaxID=1917971 RepID=UPI0017F2DDF8|nr:hypothetical protein [Sphingosinicella sp.]MBA4757738.1 hypothetical protein [Sphingosinicella sp.]
MAKPLEDRQRAALMPGARLGDVRAVLAETQTAAQAATDAAAEARAIAIDPRTPSDAARAARHAAADHEHDAERQVAAVKLLAEKVAALETADATAKRRVDEQAAEAERDALVAEWRDRVPGIVSYLIELFERTTANESRLDRLRIRTGGAEALARGVPGNFHSAHGGPINRFAEMKIPRWDSDGLAWPRRAGVIPDTFVAQRESEQKSREIARERAVSGHPVWAIVHNKLGYGVRGVRFRANPTGNPLAHHAFFAEMTAEQVTAAREIGVVVDVLGDDAFHPFHLALPAGAKGHATIATKTGDVRVGPDGLTAHVNREQLYAARRAGLMAEPAQLPNAEQAAA